MHKWDEFVDSSLDFESSFKMRSFKGHFPKFREKNGIGYSLFRKFFQICDLIILDIHSLGFSERFLSVAILYLLIGESIELFDNELITKAFALNPISISKYGDYNCLFNQFIYDCFCIEFQDILDDLGYVCLFWSMEFIFDYPVKFIGCENEEALNAVINIK